MLFFIFTSLSDSSNSKSANTVIILYFQKRNVYDFCLQVLLVFSITDILSDG